MQIIILESYFTSPYNFGYAHNILDSSFVNMNYSGGSRGGDLPPSQSAVRKKTAAVHFTTTPFEPNTANCT